MIVKHDATQQNLLQMQHGWHRVARKLPAALVNTIMSMDNGTRSRKSFYCSQPSSSL
jgi:hypothetical protein